MSKFKIKIILLIYLCFFICIIDVQAEDQFKNKTFTISWFEYLTFNNDDIRIDTYNRDGERIKEQFINVLYEYNYDSLDVVMLDKPILNNEIDNFKSPYKWKIIFDENYNNKIFIYDSYKTERVNILFSDLRIVDTMNNPQEIVVSSYMIDEEESYIAENLGITDIDTPWVSAIPAENKNETIIVKEYSDEYQNSRKDNGKSYHILSRFYKQLYSGFWMSTGYLSYLDSNTFKNYSRPKIILINDNLEIKLKDTPNLQYVSLKEHPSEIKIEILDVYKGDMFDNISVNFILPITFCREKNEDEIVPMTEEEKAALNERINRLFEKYGTNDD